MIRFRARGAAGLGDLRARLADEAGVTLIEVLVSTVILVVGTLGTFDTFIASGQSISESERRIGIATTARIT